MSSLIIVTASKKHTQIINYLQWLHELSTKHEFKEKTAEFKMAWRFSIKVRQNCCQRNILYKLQNVSKLAISLTRKHTFIFSKVLIRLLLYLQ
jgi:hypothetical protein